MEAITTTLAWASKQQRGARNHLVAGFAVTGLAMGLLLMRAEVIDILRAYLSPDSLWILSWAMVAGHRNLDAGWRFDPE